MIYRWLREARGKGRALACAALTEGRCAGRAVSRPSKSNNFSVGSTAKTLGQRMVSILVCGRGMVQVRKLIADKFGANFGVTAVKQASRARLGLIAARSP